jgi:hypothetical protein
VVVLAVAGGAFGVLAAMRLVDVVGLEAAASAVVA